MAKNFAAVPHPSTETEEQKKRGRPGNKASTNPVATPLASHGITTDLYQSCFNTFEKNTTAA